MKKNNNSISLVWCGMCRGVYVTCPVCGNNTCNGSSGRVDENGKPLPWNSTEGVRCPTCLKTYDLAEALEVSGIMDMVEDLIVDKHVVDTKDMFNWVSDDVPKELVNITEKDYKKQENDNGKAISRKRRKAKS